MDPNAACRRNLIGERGGVSPPVLSRATCREPGGSRRPARHAKMRASYELRLYRRGSRFPCGRLDATPALQTHLPGDPPCI